MGYGIRSGNIRTFTPDDTDTMIYINAEYYKPTIEEIIEKAKEKWGEDISLDNLTIGAEHIHTDCIGYDQYDSGDYTNYVTIELQE